MVSAEGGGTGGYILLSEFRGMTLNFAYFVLVCYGHSILSPTLTLSTNTTLVLPEVKLTVGPIKELNRGAHQEIVPCFYSVLLLEAFALVGALPIFGSVSEIAPVRFWHVTSLQT